MDIPTTRVPAVTPLAVLLLGFMTFGLMSCTSPETGKLSVVTTAQNARPFVRPASAAVGIGLLATAEDREKKIERAKWLFAVATVIRTVSANSPPSEADFRAALEAVTPQEKTDWLQAVVSLSSIYSGFRTQFGSDTNTVMEAVELIASGLEDAAKPYVKVASP